MKKMVAILIALVLLVMCFAGCEESQTAGSGVSEQGFTKPDGYPKGPITAICPYSAGGSTDLSLRTLLTAWEPVIGTGFVVNNVTGGSGTVAASQIKGEKTDGYLIGQLTLGNMVTSTFDIEVDYTLDDFDFIGAYLLLDFGLVVNPEGTYQTYDALLEAGKEEPIKVVTTGTTEIVALGKINKAFGTKFESVYYNSTSDAIVDLLANRVDAAICSEPALAAYIKAGQLKLLVSFSSARFSTAPDVPTIEELGYPECATNSFHGVGVPKGVDPAILAYLRETFDATVGTEEFAKSVAEKCNAVAYPMNAEDYYNFLVQQREELAAVLPELLGK